MSQLADLATLAWQPFLEPAPAVDRWWWLLIVPTAIGIALAYKATRIAELERLPREVVRMSVQIVAAMAGIAIALYAVVILLLPRLPAE